ncbi:MAG: hypothetical protein AB7P31_12710 [Steroidobacteraceae bacterium]
MEARIVAAHPLDGVRAGSALLRVGARLLAVRDDAYCAYWIDLPGLRVTPFALRDDGAALPKALKPDFEAAVHTADGSIFLLGSGSTRQRTSIARLSLSHASVVIVDRPQLYDCVRRTLDLAVAPNIEGAVIEGDVLRLFHRGTATASATIDMPLGVLEGEPPRALARDWIELGTLQGVPLSITDAVRVGPHRALFLAVAENTTDAIADGPVVGCAVGLLTGPTGRRQVRWCRVVDVDGRPSRRKLEGVAVDDDLRGAWAITDPDDPDRAAELCRIEFNGVR